MPLVVFSKPYDDAIFELNAAISASATTVTVKVNTKIPAGAPKIYADLVTRTTFGDKGIGNIEIKEPVTITNVSGTGEVDFTITRSGSPLPFSKNDIIRVGFRAQWLADIHDAVTDGLKTLAIGALRIGIPGVPIDLVDLIHPSGSTIQSIKPGGADTDAVYKFKDSAGVTVGFLGYDESLDLFKLVRGTNFGSGDTIELNSSGDVKVGGAFSVGVDKTWSRYIDAREGLPETSQGATGPTSLEILSQRIQINVLDYVNASTKRATFRCMLPPDYDGSALDFTPIWTATGGTSGDVLWRITPIVFADDETLNNGTTTTFGDVLDTFHAQKDLHQNTVSITPLSAATGTFLHFTVLRIGGDASDTFDATARLIGVRVSYT